jgi:hypothetical protein
LAVAVHGLARLRAALCWYSVGYRIACFIGFAIPCDLMASAAHQPAPRMAVRTKKRVRWESNQRFSVLREPRWRECRCGEVSPAACNFPQLTTLALKVSRSKGRNSGLIRNRTVKTSIAIALVVVTLGGIVAPVATAFAGGGGPQTWCGADVCPPKPANHQTFERSQPPTFGKSR